MRILKRVGLTGVIAAVGVVSALWAPPASAAPCSVPGSWNPLPTAANMTDCGPPVSSVDQDNDTAAGVTTSINTKLGTSFDFELWDKDEAPNEKFGPDRDPSFFYTGSTGNEVTNDKVTSGFWYWNATKSIAEGNTVFALVLKEGQSPNDPIRWAWFLLDNVDTTTDNCTLPTDFTHCGTWSMYGKDGKIKEISHISIYGSPGLLQVPIPASLILIGAGVAGLGYVTRRKLTK